MKKTMFALLTALVMGYGFIACSDKKADKDAKEGEEENTEVKADAADADEADEAASFDASDDPMKQMVGLTKDFVKVIKNTHINSAADAEALKAKAESFEAKIQDVQAAMEKQMEGMSDEEKLTFATSMIGVAKEFEGIEKDIDAEMERLKKEAEAAGIDLEDLDL